MRRPFLLFGLFMLMLPASVMGRTWYITPDGTGDAPTIQAGVDSASAGDTVLVACGIYTDIGYVAPDGVSSCVRMKSNITLLGEGDPSCVVLDAQQQGRVILCDSIVAFEITGLTIRGGNVLVGGGLMLQGAENARIARCVFFDNRATAGGGIQIDMGTRYVDIENCTFSRNHADYYGGGIRCEATDVNITGCWFEGNDGTYGGGGIFFYRHGYRNVAECVFTHNTSARTSWYGAGIDLFWANASVDNCTFFQNQGIAIVVYGPSSLLIRRCIVTGSLYGLDGHVSDDLEEPDVYAICCDVYGNTICDWCYFEDPSFCLKVDCFSECPSFCNAAAGDFHLCDGSPCLPGNHPYGADCGLIGALGEGCACGPSATEPTTWSKIKSMFK